MKIETKYNLGDEVFYIFNKKCKSSIVRGFGITVTENKTEIIYFCSDCSDSMCRIKVNESDAFKSREDLVNSL